MVSTPRKRPISELPPGATFAPATTRLPHGITAIDTDYVRPMLDASHLIVDEGRAAFVDTGANNAVPRLLAALEASDLDGADVDYVFLTHIHLDHAGGAGLLMQSLPNAVAVIHPRGARHMAAPEKLIKGSIAVYGEAAFRELYGDILAIDEGRISVAGDGDVYRLGARELTTLHTEGHARHHYCLHDPASKGVFTGDSFGISFREFDTTAGEFIYPTTTPVHFDPPEAHKAIDRIVGLDPENLYLTHYSRVADIERLATDLHRRIDDLVSLALAHEGEPNRQVLLSDALRDYLVDELVAHGVRHERQALEALLAMDVDLNVMGLLHWLDTR